MEPVGAKRRRVSTGRYNLYLREKNPLEHAPASSQRQISHILQSDSCTLEDMKEHSNDTPATSEMHVLERRQAEQLPSFHPSGESDENGASMQDNYDNCATNVEFDSDEQGDQVIDFDTDTCNEEEHDLEFDSEPEKLYLGDQVNCEIDTESCGNSDTEDLAESNENYENKAQDSGDEPVFPGSRLKVGASMLLIITFMLKYSLTGEGLVDLLNLISLHCPIGNVIVKSIRSFKKWFQNIKHPLKVHKYCSLCHIIISEEHLITGICPNTKCGHDISGSSSVSHFIEIPIAEQIKSLFARPSFYYDIQHRFTRKKKKQHSVEDIYDGNVYTRLSEEGQILHSPHNLSLLWNTDGVPCFKSSNMSLWPLFFQINELPYTKRCSPDNMILGGLWFGPKKPTMLLYTEPFIKTLNDLETTGITIIDPTNLGHPKPFTCKVIVIGGTADLPARSVVCNTMQFNGKYGCCKCLQPGETCKTSARGHVHTFPFDPENPNGPTRTHEGNLADSVNAVQNNKPCRGIKGPSFLQCLSFYNLVSGTCIDYMHGVVLGVTKLLMSLWFLPEHSKESFSISSYVELVDKRLKFIKPPNNIARLPRSIKEHLKYWKASELRSWLLYYSLPILKDIQSEEYYQHFLLFVNAIHLMLQDSISVDDINKSDALLTNFCCLFAALYGDRYMTCNMHQLLHFPEMVMDMGPLWAYSCFPFENANGTILKLFNGTQNVDFQIVDSVNLMQNLPYIQKSFLEPGTPEEILYQNMKGTLKRNDTHLQDNIYMVGGSKKGILNASELIAVSQFLNHAPILYITFNRIRIDNEIFHSKLYKRVLARNSYCIAYTHSSGKVEFGLVAFYLQLYPFCEQHGRISKYCACKTRNVALVDTFEEHSDGLQYKLSKDNVSGADVHFIKVFKSNTSERLHVVPLESVLYKCVFVELQDRKELVYVCKMPNFIEQD